MSDEVQDAAPRRTQPSSTSGSAGETVLRDVWDLPVRIFHWVLVVAVTTGWLLGKYGPFDKSNHFYVGYAIGVLLVLRLIWGFVGTKPARFSSFVASPASVMRYVARMFSRRPSYWYGHNPLGGWFVVAMLAALAVQVLTGLMADDEIANSGPLAGIVGATWSAEATAWHYTVSRVLLGLVGLHVAAIFFYWLWKREDLVKPMISGQKLVRIDADGPDKRSTTHSA